MKPIPSIGLLVLFGSLIGAGPATTLSTIEITVVTKNADDLKAYGKDIQRLAVEWYPKLCDLLPSDGFTPPSNIEITFEEYDGVAETSGDKIRCNARWFRERPNDRGAVIHELVHVVQHYHSDNNPGWLVEGIADYIRFYHFEPADERPHPQAGQARYDDSYRTTGAFLDWAQTKYDKKLVQKLNAACREGIYSPKVWKDITGKEEKALGEEWQSTLEK